MLSKRYYHSIIASILDAYEEYNLMNDTCRGMINTNPILIFPLNCVKIRNVRCFLNTSLKVHNTVDIRYRFLFISPPVPHVDLLLLHLQEITKQSETP